MNQDKIHATSESSPFLQSHSASIRIWHWMTFFIFATLILTVVLNSTLLSSRKNSVIIQDVLKEKGVIVTPVQASSVSRIYTEKIWEVHKFLGVGLTILLLARIVIELVQSGEEKFSSRFKNAMGFYRKGEGNKSEYRHYLWVKCGYILFYILLLIMIISGLGLAFGRQISFLGKMHKVMKTIHGMDQLFMYGFVLIHLISVIIADISKSKGILSGMVNGNKS